MSALDEIREFAKQTPCRNSDMHQQCTRQDRDRLLAAVEGVLALASKAPRFTVFGGESASGIVAADDVIDAITVALEATK